jgi:ABC-type Mn2+/Zn2+ transport system ATPase subunit
VLGANGSGKSHFLRLLARGGTDPEPGTVPAGAAALAPVAHGGTARLGRGWCRGTSPRPTRAGSPGTVLDALVAGDADRPGRTVAEAMRALARYELAGQAEQPFSTLSGGQQARVQILLLELSGATLLLLDEPTDNLDLASAEALEQALAAFEGTVVAVTHDRWFTRGFDRFVVFGEDGEVRETPQAGVGGGAGAAVRRRVSAAGDGGHHGRRGDGRARTGQGLGQRDPAAGQHEHGRADRRQPRLHRRHADHGHGEQEGRARSAAAPAGRRAGRPRPPVPAAARWGARPRPAASRAGYG